MKRLLFVLMMLALAYMAKPKCYDSYSYTEAATGSCNERTYNIFDGNCAINGCHPALADPCWTRACENGHFNEEKWDALTTEWKNENWNNFLSHYGYTLREGCDSRDMHCYPVERIINFDKPGVAAFSCCVPICVDWDYEEVAASMPRLSQHCDFSEGNIIGFMKIK